MTTDFVFVKIIENILEKSDDILGLAPDDQ